MRRREFLTLLGGAAATWPLAARAQQVGGRPTSGFLGVSSSSAWTHWTAAFVQRLGELGWTDGRNVAIEYRWAEGRGGRFAEFAAEFVRRKVDVIVTGGSAVHTAMQATSTIPIVFAIAVDPIAMGLVTNLARPGGNVTGLSVLSNETASKRLQILSEVIPNLRRLAVLGNVGNAGPVDEMREVQSAAQVLGVEIDRLEKFDAGRILRPLSSDSRAGRRRCTCAPMRWSTPIVPAWASWHWACGCRPCSVFGSTSIRQA